MVWKSFILEKYIPMLILFVQCYVSVVSGKREKVNSVNF